MGFLWLVLVSLGLFLLGLGLLLARFILFWVVWLVLAHFMSLSGLLWHVLGCLGSFRENLSRFGSTWINLALFLDCFGLFWIFLTRFGFFWDRLQSILVHFGSF